jgi:hypothetical protein
MFKHTYAKTHTYKHTSGPIVCFFSLVDTSLASEDTSWINSARQAMKKGETDWGS